MCLSVYFNINRIFIANIIIITIIIIFMTHLFCDFPLTFRLCSSFFISILVHSKRIAIFRGAAVVLCDFLCSLVCYR